VPKLGFKHWLSRRFVVLSEIVGYVLAALVGAAVVYSMLTKVDVVAKISGEAKPSASELTLDRDALLTAQLAAPGSDVVGGVPILRIAADPKDQRRILARRRLTAAIVDLEAEADEQSRAALDESQRALEVLPLPAQEEDLAAPAAGFVAYRADLADVGTIPAGEALAIVYQSDRLLLETTLGDTAADQLVAPGQEVRATVPESGDRLTGRVVSVDPERKVLVAFSDIPEEVQKRIRAAVLDESALRLPVLNAEVVVGSQSLFKQMFGKKT